VLAEQPHVVPGGVVAAPRGRCPGQAAPAEVAAETSRARPCLERQRAVEKDGVARVSEPQTEVEVLEAEEQVGVVDADPSGRCQGDQRELAARHVVDVDDAVQLVVTEADGPAGPQVEARAGLADEADRRSLALLALTEREQALQQRVVLRRVVVVEQDHPVRVATGFERATHALRETPGGPGVLGHRDVVPDGGRMRAGLDDPPGLVRRSVVDHDEVVDASTLRGEHPQELGERARAPVGDEHPEERGGPGDGHGRSLAEGLHR
jgi:hypothetical protein